jgi:glycolate dehydrogenase iron-sulfur subunit
VASAFDAHHPPARELLDDCVHCGFCLQACPTYQIWGEEADSPRGRILLMDAALRGTVELSGDLVRHWDQCLGCMACVPACPSGVRYDRLIEQTRQQVERRHRRDPGDRLLRSALFMLLPHPRRMRALAALLVAYRASGARRLARRSGLLARVPRPLRLLEGLAPPLDAAALRSTPPALQPARGPRRLRVALLTGCVQHAFFSEVNAAATRVLAAWGCEVVTPPRQPCCGALELHSGREGAALSRARALVERLEAAGADRVAVTSAGCGSAMKEYGELLADDPAWAARAARLAATVRDVSELLAELGTPPPLSPLPMRLAYHDACHLAWAQGVRDQPRALLAAIPGVELVPVPPGEACCGSAGIYNLVEPEAAGELGRRTAARILGAAPDAVAAGNPGCLLQVGAHLAARRATLPLLHPVELLDASLRGTDAGELLQARRRRWAGMEGAIRP